MNLPSVADLPQALCTLDTPECEAFRKALPPGSRLLYNQQREVLGHVPAFEPQRVEPSTGWTVYSTGLDKREYQWLQPDLQQHQYLSLQARMEKARVDRG